MSCFSHHPSSFTTARPFLWETKSVRIRWKYPLTEKLHRARMSGQFDSRKGPHPSKLERTSRILSKQNFRESCDLKLSAITFIKLWDSSMFYRIFLSPQEKRCAIITYKHGIYELPHEFPNDVLLRILGN